MFQTILVPVDVTQSDSGEAALEAGMAIANGTGAKLVLLNVVGDVPNLVALQLPAGILGTAIEEARGQLDAMAKRHGLAEGAYEVAVRQGTIYHEILSEAEATGTDLIVIASHKPDAATYLLGSVAAKVVRHAGCSVFVVRD